MTSSLKLYTQDQLLRTREENGGVLLGPLYVGKLFASAFELIFFPYAYLTGYYSYVQANGTFAEYLKLYVLIQFAIQGLGNLIACTFTSKIKSLIASGILVILWAFGGVTPSFSEIEDRMGPLVILNYLSPFKWSLELNCLLELDSYSPTWNSSIENFLDYLDWDRGDMVKCIVNLVMYGIITNLLALVILEIRRDNYKMIRPQLHFVHQSYRTFVMFINRKTRNFIDCILPTPIPTIIDTDLSHGDSLESNTQKNPVHGGV